MERVFGPIEGWRLFRRYVTEQSRSGLYRESTPPEEVPADLQIFDQIEGRLEIGVAVVSPDAAILKVYAPRPMELTETLRMLQNLGPTVRDEMSLPLVAAG